MSEPFRSATSGDSPSELASMPDAVSKDSPVTRNTDSPAYFTYEALHGSPYTVKHFNLEAFWDSPTSEMQDAIKEVDTWVLDQAKARHLADKQDSYQEIIDQILNQIGKSDNEKPDKTFERVSKAIEAHKRLAEAKLPPVLDVQSLTPDEYKATRAE